MISLGKANVTTKVLIAVAFTSAGVGKFQISNPKLQGSSNHQTPGAVTRAVIEALNFEASLGFGAWVLVLKFTS